MFKLLKKLFAFSDGPRTVVVLDDNGAEPSTSHRFNPLNLWLLCVGAFVGTVGLLLVLLFFTPLGGLVYNQHEMRNSVIAIQQKVAALQDTIMARNLELKSIQKVLITGKDTSFASSGNEPGNREPAASTSPPKPAVEEKEQAETYAPNNNNFFLVSNLFKNSPEFPAPYPIAGTPTRLFNNAIGHYGLDIAAQSGSSFKAVADGVVISEEWTINYGYVIMVQHSAGIISIYKHATSLNKEIGQSVLKGDILGTVGNIGILSSGPHLHIEIWKKGVPQDPENYLINS